MVFRIRWGPLAHWFCFFGKWRDLDRDEAPRGHQFTAGTPGSWDDSGVKDPYVVEDATGEHLWYSGFDGSNWRIGYAFRAKGNEAFERTILDATEEACPVVGLTGGLFHRGGVTRPVVSAMDDGFRMFYAGSSSGNARVGACFRYQSHSLQQGPQTSALGDQLIFDTQKGDADMHAIPLDGYHADRTTTGIGLTALHHDAERGMLFAVSKLHATIFAIDVRDDTDPWLASTTATTSTWKPSSC